MAKTPRASKASDATASTTTKAAKKAAPKPAPAPKKTAPAPAPTPAPKKAAKKTAPAPAPAPKKAAKKTAPAPAPAPKKAAKKTAPAPAPAPKKAAKKTAPAPARKKASKKKAKTAEQSEQLALSMDVDPHAAPAAPAASAPLQPGDRVPDFSLESDDGQTYSRQGLAGTRYVVYFYPKDDTPGCTRQACDFRDHRPQLDAANVKVFGISSDGLKSHGKFRSKYGLDFPLLSDPDRAVAQAFGVVGIKKLYGKTNIGVIRSTFVVGPNGVIETTFSPVKVDGHADAVLRALG